MKRSSLFLSMAILTAGSALGQATPTHPLDISGIDFASDASFPTWFPAWEIGTPPAGVSKMDDEFFKSRTRPLERISKENDTYDANPDAPYERKFCGFYGATDPTSTWFTFPRYCFEGDNYSMWSYTDMFSNWTSPFFRCTAGLSDVAAKNGASVGCCWTISYGRSATFNTSYVSSTEGKKFAALCKKDSDGNFLYAEKLVKLMKYYGINAVGFNSEFHSNAASMTILSDFFAECHKIADEIGWKFEVHWYAGTNDNGTLAFDQGLYSFDKIFGTADHKMTDMLFLNYNWTQGQLNGMEAAAAKLNRSSYDVFAGFDIQGRGLRRTKYTNTGGWNWIEANPVSIGFWGAHAQNLIHESSTDYGTSDLALQQAYLKKQELISNGGYNNPAVRPKIDENISGLGIAGLSKFHGLAQMMTAKSSIQQLPFVTRFSLGNGQKFYNRGEVAFDSKWYNLGTQDFLPTWRWWITDASDNATEASLAGFVKAELMWDDAWFGGSCLSLSGATDFSRVKLFKTLLEAKPNEELSIVYKPIGSADSHLKLFVSLKGAVTDYKQIAVPAGKPDEWNTFTAKLSDLGVESGQIALIGLVVENTTDTYKTYVGELALRDPAQTFAPVKPTVKEVEILRGRYNAVDFKMRYAAKEESGEMKTYNDEVDTWYYEIFIQQENQEPILLTATPSWAAYVIGAPIKSGYEGRSARFGVRAVSPDGDMYNNNVSDIAWSEYMDIPYNQPLTDLDVNKTVIKPNETFTVKYVDDMAPAAQKWEIISAVTGDAMATAENSSSVTTKLSEIGVYDLRVTDNNGNVNMMRAKIQVTPEATGATPEITSISVDKSTAETAEEVTYSYTGREGEGKVSRALKISDPQMLQIPGEIQEGNEYSYALWFKPESFAHLSNGTNLISKNTIYDLWPHNNWGDLWVQIRGAGQSLATGYTGGESGSLTEGNEISFNVMGWEAHQVPWINMISTGYNLSEGSWYHLVVTQTSGKEQCMYINGKLIKKATATFAKRRSDYTSDSRVNQSVVANIHIGGSGVYKAAFNGAVDEIQVWNKALSADEVIRAMNGYAEDEVPEGLQGYYTFETMNADGTFPNLGKAGADKTAKIVVAEDTGGETTNSGSYVQYEADNTLLGNPGIEGTLDVTTTAEWNLTGATVESTDGSTATVVYNAPGKYNAELTLKNGWGSDTMTEPEIVEITGTVGIDDTFAEGNLEVTSYNGVVSFRFAEGGAYTINIVALDGKTVQSNVINAEAGSTATVALNASNGVYLVQVILNGHQVKVVKIVK